MAKRKSRKPPKPKTGGKPDPKHNRKQSKPNSPAEEVQACHDEIKATIMANLNDKYASYFLIRESFRMVLGQGGLDLKQFIDEFEGGYDDSVQDKDHKYYGQDKDERPILERHSQRLKIDVPIPIDNKKPQGKGTPEKKSPKPRRRK